MQFLNHSVLLSRKGLDPHLCVDLNLFHPTLGGWSEGYYLSSTSAPTSSRAFFKASAVALSTPSLTLEGAASTMSLASFRPRPVCSLTALTTWSLLAPALFRTTSKEVFSSAAAASPPAAGAAATATAAAAGSIPYSSLRIVA